MVMRLLADDFHPNYNGTRVCADHDSYPGISSRTGI